MLTTSYSSKLHNYFCPLHCTHVLSCIFVQPEKKEKRKKENEKEINQKHSLGNRLYSIIEEKFTQGLIQIRQKPNTYLTVPYIRYQSLHLQPRVVSNDHWYPEVQCHHKAECSHWHWQHTPSMTE